MTTDRRKLNDLELAECAALKAEIAAHNSRAETGKRLTQEFLAQELGMTQGNLSSHLNGKRAISKEMASKMALLLGIQVDRFSPRLAAEIAVMAQAVRAAPMATETAEQQAAYAAGHAAALIGLATPRSRAVLQRINQAAIDGRLSEADIDLLDQIAARFEHKGGQAPGGEGSHKRLREKLLDHDPHSKK